MTARLWIMMGTDNRALRAAVTKARPGFSDPAYPPPWPVAVLFPEIVDGSPAHPSLHGDLADRCVSGVFGPVPVGYGTAAGLILCTHSDVFVLRVRRRIAEGTLRPEDVALVWVEPDGTEKPILLNGRGTPAWWPKHHTVSVFAEAQEEFQAIRRALHDRDRRRPPDPEAS